MSNVGGVFLDDAPMITGSSRRQFFPKAIQSSSSPHCTVAYRRDLLLVTSFPVIPRTEPAVHRCSIEKLVKNIAKFLRKYLCREIFCLWPFHRTLPGYCLCQRRVCQSFYQPSWKSYRIYLYSKLHYVLVKTTEKVLDPSLTLTGANWY